MLRDEVGRISSWRLFRPGKEVSKTRRVSVLLVIGSHRWILGRGVLVVGTSVCKGFVQEWMKGPEKPQGMEGGTALPSQPGEVGFTEDLAGAEPCEGVL